MDQFDEICLDISFALETINTEIKKQQAFSELRTASHYARSLIEVSLNPLVTISSEGKITDVNKATECNWICKRRNYRQQLFKLFY